MTNPQWQILNQEIRSRKVLLRGQRSPKKASPLLQGIHPRLCLGSWYSRRGMSTPERKKINLRRPDVMEAVQAQVLSHYRSGLVNRIREKGHVLSADGLLTIKLAKEFGFCYGVERAIDLAYAARKVFPLPQPIYLLGEIIH